MPKRKPEALPVIRKIRVLVYGGRDQSEPYAFIWLVRNGENTVAHMLGTTHFRIDAIVHGGANGADKAGDRWARFMRVRPINFEAEFRHLGRGAGLIRNKIIADHGKIDCAIEFPGNKGTQDMRLRLAGRDIPFFQVKEV